MRELKSLRSLILRPEIASICLVAFMADLVAGIVVPTFSLYATSLGASLALVGALTGMAGFTSIFASLPIGMLSDAKGRKSIIVGGMFLFALSSLLYTIVPTPLLLFPIRILASLGMVAVFMVGVAYVGDVVEREERGLALGLYSTGMALGFTVGPAIGGFLAELSGYRASYAAATLISTAGLLIAIRGLEGGRREKSAQVMEATRATIPFMDKWRALVRNPQMMAASFAHLGNNVAFTTIFSFLPLYAATLSVGDAALGSMFTARGLASTFSRIPTGLLTQRVPGRLLMMIGLILATALMFILSRTTSASMLALILIGDGIAYGIFLTAGQSHITELASEEERGSAVGIYTMAGSIGAAVGPVALGFIAEWFGFGTVFQLAGGLALLTAVILLVVRNK